MLPEDGLAWALYGIRVMNVRPSFSSPHPWSLFWQRRRATPKEVPRHAATHRPIHQADIRVLFIRIPY